MIKIGLIGLGSIGSVLAFHLLKSNEIELYVVSGRVENNISLLDKRTKSENKMLQHSKNFFK